MVFIHLVVTHPTFIQLLVPGPGGGPGDLGQSHGGVPQRLGEGPGRHPALHGRAGGEGRRETGAMYE